MLLTGEQLQELEKKGKRIAALERQVLFAKIKADNGTTSATPEVNAVQVKLPDFYENDPEMWFMRAEFQFRTRGIKDDLTKFDHIMQSLSEKVARRVRKMVLYPPATDRVKTNKN